MTSIDSGQDLQKNNRDPQVNSAPIDIFKNVIGTINRNPVKEGITKLSQNQNSNENYLEIPDQKFTFGPINPGNDELIIKDAVFFFMVNAKSGGQIGKHLIDMHTKYQKLTNELFDTKYPEYQCIHVYVSELTNTSDREEGFESQKKCTNKSNNMDDIFVIACGGDGTVMWVLEECISKQIDLSNINFTLLPFGTGNDFAIATGFSPDCPAILTTNPYKGIQKQLELYLSCDRKYLDIWDVEIKCFDDGCIKQIHQKEGKSEKKPMVEVCEATNKEYPLLNFNRKMCNYASIGIDARIGFGFEKKRSNKRWLNKFMYAWEGARKFVWKESDMNNLIRKLEVVEEFEDMGSDPTNDDGSVFFEHPLGFDYKNISEYKSENVPQGQAEMNLIPARNMLKHQSSFEGYKNVGGHKRIHSNSETYDNHNNFENQQRDFMKKTAQVKIIKEEALKNITKGPSRNGSANKIGPKENSDHSNNTNNKRESDITHRTVKSTTIFRTKKTTLKRSILSNVQALDPVNLICSNINSFGGGVQNMWNNASDDVPILDANKEKGEIKDKQDFGDGKLEFMSFDSKMKFGTLERIGISGQGKKIAQGGGPFLITFKRCNSTEGKPIKAYAQVDGEFMQLIQPESMRISQCGVLANGKIKVLFKE